MIKFCLIFMYILLCLLTVIFSLRKAYDVFKNIVNRDSYKLKHFSLLHKENTALDKYFNQIMDDSFISVEDNEYNGIVFDRTLKTTNYEITYWTANNYYSFASNGTIKDIKNLVEVSWDKQMPSKKAIQKFVKWVEDNKNLVHSKI